MLHGEATQMTNAEVIARNAEEEPIEVTIDEIRGYIEVDTPNSRLTP